jgi:serine phosphatase RsbU (regulator of sigma subunit)/anti-sigma regulatory factor (Ser/Thr protein kinase)
MISIRALWRRQNNEETKTPEAVPVEANELATRVGQLDLDIAPNDPLLAYLQSTSGAVDVRDLRLGSPALERLRTEGIVLVLPLVSQRELVGLVNLGPRLSEQDYSSDDRKLLADLAAQAAPAVRVAQLVRQQQEEIRERERIEQELRVARVIQQTLLPKELPSLPGWKLNAYWQPARAVGGDFYDFIPYEDGRLAICIADVTDKGVPAALVMASARSILRAAAERLGSPGAVLERANELLCPDIPQNMFVTCLYILLDPVSGHIIYANAGHNLPSQCTTGGVVELRATGMPLGLMPGMSYEEKEATIAPGDSVLVYSDGLTEAHSPQGEMFGFPRLRELLAANAGREAMIDFLRRQLTGFTGPDWEQEDDVTFVVVERTPQSASKKDAGKAGWTTLADFEVASAPNNERQAMEQVAQAVEGLDLSPARRKRLGTAVAEATMNAMEHGNGYQPDLPVAVQALVGEEELIVRITDSGGGQAIPEPDTPDLEAKLTGAQAPRGWGLFLIRNMVDDMHVLGDDTHHTIELVMKLGESDGNSSDL